MRHSHARSSPGGRSLTERGLARVGRHYAPIGEAFARQFAGYTGAELRTVLKFMRDSREVSEVEIDRIRGAGTPHASRPH
ncbi:MAG TPA: hypothetical protein VFE59_26700 [Trebonia sp.]|nr:hypothetical protein [Trebonia sp.]